MTPPPNGGTDPNSVGFVALTNNPTGPDRIAAAFTGLAPNTCYTMVLTNTPVSGSTPGYLLGQFCADGNGGASFSVKTEIVNAFIFTNRVLDTDGDGSVVGMGAGVLANGGTVIPTSILRVYRAKPGTGPATVFGASPTAPGGLHTLSSGPIR